MRNLISFFIRRYVMAIAIFGAMALFGVISLQSRGIEFFPDISLPIVTVTTVYRGATPEEMARDVSEVIEDELITIPNIATVSSSNFDGLSLVIAEFEFDVDVDEAAISVDQKVSAITGLLPENADAPTVDKFDPTDAPVLSFVVLAPGEDLLDVQDFAEDTLEPALLQVRDVAQVSVVGETERQVFVYLEPDWLERYGLSALAVNNAIQQASSDQSAGDISIAGQRSLIASKNSFTSAQDVSEALIDSTTGLRVSDVAVVREGHEEITSYTRFNGQSAVLVEVRQASGSNSVAVANDVLDALAEFQLPEGYSTEVVLDAASFTESMVSNTTNSIIQAVIAVALVTLFFLGRLGSTFSVALAIPLTMAGAFIFMQFVGLDINLMTLVAITVAVGIVVDDSTVIAENGEKRLAKGLKRKDAALEGAGEVANAVLASALALLAVFVPLSLLPGVVGQFFANFALVMAATIVVSYFEAMFFLPVRLAYLPNPLPASWRDLAGAPRRIGGDILWGLRLYLKPLVWVVLVVAGLIMRQQFGLLALAVLAAPFALGVIGYVFRLIITFLGAITRSIYQVVDAGMQRLSQAYGNAVGTALNHTWLVFIITGLFVASLGIAGRYVQFTFVPEYDTEALTAILELPAGSSLETTDQLSGLVEGALLEHPEVTNVLTVVGSGEFAGQASAELAEFTVLTTPKNSREDSVYALAPQVEGYLQEVLANYPEADIRVDVGSTTGGDDDATRDVFRQSIYSDDLAAVRNAEPDVFAFFDASPDLRNVTSDLGNAINERSFIIDRASLVGTGIAISDISRLLRLYNVGTTVAQLEADSSSTVVNPYTDADVVVTVDPTLVADEQSLLSLPVYAPALQTSLPLSTFGGFETRLTLSQINRVDQQYGVNFEADPAPSVNSTLALQSDLRARAGQENVTAPNVRIADASGVDPTAELAQYAPIALVVAILLNYLVIASQFNSFRFPLYLLSTVPLGVVGAIWTLVLTNTQLTVFGVLGITMLVGLVTKNAILLLEVVLVTMEEKDMTLREALVEAATARLRPIIMTTITVIIIGIPMVTSQGIGAEILYSLGWVIVGGMTVAAFLTLFLVPAAFYHFERKHYGDVPAVSEGETASPTGLRRLWSTFAKQS
ncbi:MAG: efflux RND transporter permease subunit [Deinococcota bacterium]